MGYQGRFKSFPVQEDEHFYSVTRYVERNALRAKLVRRAEAWRFGSLYRWQRRSAQGRRLLTAWSLPRKSRCGLRQQPGNGGGTQGVPNFPMRSDPNVVEITDPPTKKIAVAKINDAGSGRRLHHCQILASELT